MAPAERSRPNRAMLPVTRPSRSKSQKQRARIVLWVRGPSRGQSRVSKCLAAAAGHRRWDLPCFPILASMQWHCGKVPEERIDAKQPCAAWHASPLKDRNQVCSTRYLGHKNKEQTTRTWTTLRISCCSTKFQS